MKKLNLAWPLAALLFLSALSASASWSVGSVAYGRSVGIAVHTPNVLTSFASTPDVGVTLPTGTVSVTVCVATNDIHYFHHPNVAPTATLGLVMKAGQCYVLSKDPRLISTFRFIDTSAGASSVTIEFYGEETP